MSYTPDEGWFEIQNADAKGIVEAASRVAKRLAKSDGYKLPDGIKIYESDNPRALAYWAKAEAVMEELYEIDMGDVLFAFECDEEGTAASRRAKDAN